MDTACRAARREGDQSQAWLDLGAAAEPLWLSREGFALGSCGCRGFSVPLGPWWEWPGQGRVMGMAGTAGTAGSSGL